MALVSSNQLRYVSCDAWTHIFSEAEFSEIERTTRWVFDRQEQALVFVDVQRDQKLRSWSRSEIEDVTDSLVNGNPGCLDKIGRAHVYTPLPNSHLVCLL